MQRFLISTGIVIFPIWAESPRQAIESLKDEIRYRGRRDPFQSHHSSQSLRLLDEIEPARSALNRLDIGMSLVEALAGGRLNFLVFTGDHSAILAGELQGQYQEPASRKLASLQAQHTTPMLVHALPSDPQ